MKKQKLPLDVLDCVAHAYDSKQGLRERLLLAQGTRPCRILWPRGSLPGPARRSVGRQDDGAPGCIVWPVRAWRRQSLVTPHYLRGELRQ